MSEPPRLEVAGAHVRFGSTAALDGVDLALAAGEVVAVLGPSGSGKSTLLRAIAGLQALDRGTVRLDGRDVTPVPPHRRGVGLMFQDHALFPHRDVGENVAFGLRMQGRPRQEVDATVGALLELVGLAGTQRRAVQTLSGGEQQRVALARALAARPRVLLLDEPLGSLDRSLRDRLVVELQQLFAQLRQSVVAVTHDQQEAFALADRVVLISAGSVVRSGTPAEVWRDPRRRVVAELLGFANLVPATGRDGAVCTPWGPVALPAGDARGRHVLVRPRAVRLGPKGPGAAVVAARRFAGDRVVLQLRVEGAPPLEAEVADAAAPALGEAVRYELDPAGVSLLDP